MLGYMRASLVILALTLACVGCQQAQLGERPSFYDRNNLAEYYGRCPKCQRWVKGYYSHLLYHNASGVMGCDSRVAGTCKRCGVFLVADDSGSITNESRIVRWRGPG